MVFYWLNIWICKIAIKMHLQNEGQIVWTYQFVDHFNTLKIFWYVLGIVNTQHFWQIWYNSIFFQMILRIFQVKPFWISHHCPQFDLIKIKLFKPTIIFIEVTLHNLLLVTTVDLKQDTLQTIPLMGHLQERHGEGYQRSLEQPHSLLELLHYT